VTQGYDFSPHVQSLQYSRMYTMSRKVGEEAGKCHMDSCLWFCIMVTTLVGSVVSSKGPCVKRLVKPILRKKAIAQCYWLVIESLRGGAL
jgi:hypothetical protein